MHKKKSVSESDIKVLKGLESVRKKPAMYIGYPDGYGMFTILREVMDNAVDEYIADNDCDSMSILENDGYYIVHDNGQGIPTGKHRTEGISTLEVVVAMLHAGGKLSEGGVYEASRGCFSGDTKIKLLNGKSQSLKKLHRQWKKNKKPFWVYSFDRNGEFAFAPGKCIKVHKTKKVANVCIVTLDSGAEITCTLDHPFLCLDNSYVQANHLRRGTSLRALYTIYDKDGYEVHSSRTSPYAKENSKGFSASGGKQTCRTNRTVAYNLEWDVDDLHVHHKNGVKTNNEPSNLKALDRRSHFWEDYNENQKHQEFVKKDTKRFRKASKRNAKKMNKAGYDGPKGKVLQCAARALRDFGKVNKETYTVCRGWSYPSFIKALTRFNSLRKLHKAAKQYLKEWNKNQERTYNGSAGLNYKLLSEYDKAPIDNILDTQNHKVKRIDIITLDKPIWMYDLTVENYHNYLLDDGVFVHNTHGIGVSATNALSEHFQVWTCRNDQWWHAEYKQGKCIQHAHKVKVKDIEAIVEMVYDQGTIVRFKPDKSVFDVGSKLDYSLITEWAETTSYLTEGFTIEVWDHKGEDWDEYQQEDGLTQWIKDYVEEYKCEEMLSEPIIIRSKNVDLCMTFTDADTDGLYGYCNGLYQTDGGDHVRQTLSTLYDTVAYYGKIRDNFDSKDLQPGIIGMVNFKIDSPRFTSQTKEKLTDKRFNELCVELIEKELYKYWGKHKDEVKDLIARAVQQHDAKNIFKTQVKAIKSLKETTNRNKKLPIKLVSVPDCAPEERELFLVEGDSAAGTASSARMTDPYRYQETLGLRGKLINSYKTTPERLIHSKEILAILSAIGYDPSKKKPLQNCRVGKIILLSDPDPDGAHIDLLEVSFFANLLPELLRKEMIYTVASPKYILNDNDIQYFGSTIKEIRDQVPKNVKVDMDKVSYLKGFGEMKAKALRPVAFDPRTRKLIKIKKPSETQLNYLECLMGGDVSTRRELLGV